MSDISLVFLKTNAVIDSLKLDASLSETHQTAIEVTDHPVEEGVDMSDHRRRKPDSVVIKGLVTNDPTPAPNAASSPTTFTVIDSEGNQKGTLNYYYRSQFDAIAAGRAYQTLLDLADSKRLITIVTAIRSYDGMTMTQLDVPRDAASGQALEFTATFREIRVVQNQTIKISAKTTRASKNQNLSKKVPPEASDAQKRPKSVLKSVTDSTVAKHPVDSLVDGLKKLGGG